jgi:hypothetical protein
MESKNQLQTFFIGKKFLNSKLFFISTQNFRCPFEGLHVVQNLTFTNEVIDIFPTGTYQLSAIGHDKEDSKIFQLIATFNIN